MIEDLLESSDSVTDSISKLDGKLESLVIGDENENSAIANNIKTASFNDFTSSHEELVYNCDTQESAELIPKEINNYNLDTQSDFESLNDLVIIPPMELNISLSDISESDAENSESSLVNEFISEIELDSFLAKLTLNNIENIINNDTSILNNITIYSKNKYFKSETFNKIKNIPCLIGYLYFYNYKVKLLTWTKEEFHVTYEKILKDIKKRIDIMIKNSNFDAQLIESKILSIAKLPNQLNPGGGSWSIHGFDAVYSLLQGITRIAPTVLYIRGSKIPISKNCNSIIKFNEFLHRLIDNDFEEENNSTENEDQLSKVQNRIDWAYNFYEIIYDFYNESDYHFIVQFIENYFVDTLDVLLKVKKVTNYFYHYLSPGSVCFTGDVFNENIKIGQIISYYHNSINYRNETIGNSRSAPRGISAQYANLLEKNSSFTDIIASYTFNSKILDNGIIRRIEIRAFKFNHVTVEFPTLLKDLCFELKKKFIDRKLKDKHKFINNRKSKEITPKDGFMNIFVNNDNNERSFGYNLIFSNYLQKIFYNKVNTLIYLMEKSVTTNNVDMLLFIIIEEVLFVSFNGMRSKGVKYSFSHALLELFVLKIFKLDYLEKNLADAFEKELKKIFIDENIKIMENLNIEINGEALLISKVIDYNMIVGNFMFKEVYALENTFRILCILKNDHNYLLEQVIEKQPLICDRANDVLIFETVIKDIIMKVIMKQVICDFFELFRKHESISNNYRHEWIVVKIKLTEFYIINCFYKKYEDIDAYNIILEAMFNENIKVLPYSHMIRKRKRNTNCVSVLINDWINELYDFLIGRYSINPSLDNAEISDVERSFISSRMMMNILIHYLNIFKMNIDIKRVIIDYFNKMEVKFNKNNNNFNMIVPEFKFCKLSPLHSQDLNGFMWIKLVSNSNERTRNLTQMVNVRNGLTIFNINTYPAPAEADPNTFQNEFNLISNLFSKLSFDKSFLFQVYLTNCSVTKETYEEFAGKYQFSTHLILYWDIVLRNRNILLANDFKIFLSKSANFQLLVNGISMIKTCSTILYILYISSIVVCNKPSKFTKKITKKEMLKILPFLNMNKTLRAPMEIDEKRYKIFCKQLKNAH